MASSDTTTTTTQPAPVTNPGSYGSSSAGATPPSPSGVATQAPVTQGTFPQSATNEGLGTNGTVVNTSIPVATFLSDNQITGTEVNTFVTQGTNGQPALNANAVFLMQFRAMTPDQRQQYEEAMVNAGLMSSASATGILTSTSLTAFKSAIANAAFQNTPVDQYLQQYQGDNNVNVALANATTNAEKEAQAPITVNQTAAPTLAAGIANAFDQALGYAPDQTQINQWIADFHGQETANQAAPHQAAEAQLAQLKSDQSQLSKMGPNDITAVMSAYTSAIHGLNPIAGNAANQQGVATGTTLAPGVLNTNPAGVLAGPMAPASTTPAGPSYGIGGAIGHDLGVLTFGGGSNKGFVGPDTARSGAEPIPASGGGMIPAPEQPIGTPGTVPTYGGMYALTPADWTQAQKLNPQLAALAKKNNWNAAGQAPVEVQRSALQSLLSDAHEKFGNWTDAIIAVAGGNPNSTVAGSKTNAHTFAVGIAAQVNDQLTQLANNINNNNITIKTTQPNAADEEAQIAKQADPVGYYANNFGSWGSLASKMLYGTPLAEMQQSSDSFTGPVGSLPQLAGQSAAPATTATGGAPPPVAPPAAPAAAPVPATTAA